MQQDFHSQPIRVLLSCRYSNGRTMTYAALAVSYGDSSVRVLSTESFEKGTLLKILAPFLKGPFSCRVLSATRPPERPGYLELELKLLANPAAAVEQAEAAGDKTTHPGSDELPLMARELAAQLEASPTLRCSEVLENVAPTRRPLASAVTAIAVVLVLRDKIGLDLPRLVEAAKGEMGAEHLK